MRAIAVIVVAAGVSGACRTTGERVPKMPATPEETGAAGVRGGEASEREAYIAMVQNEVIEFQRELDRLGGEIASDDVVATKVEEPMAEAEVRVDTLDYYLTLLEGAPLGTWEQAKERAEVARRNARVAVTAARAAREALTP